MSRSVLTPEARFWSHVDKSGPIVRAELGRCWVWTGALYTRGYGHVCFRGQEQGAHRVSFTLTNGEFDRALNVCHRCDNPPCVRPDHLFIGTVKDNMRDKMRKGRHDCGVGERNANAKLTDRLVIEVRLLARRGVSHECIARKLGMHPCNITRAVNGESWKHVKSMALAEQLTLSVVV